MEYIREISISLEKYVRILMLSRMANGEELLPTYEPSEEDIIDFCPAISLISGVGKSVKHNIDIKELN